MKLVSLLQLVLSAALALGDDNAPPSESALHSTFAILTINETVFPDEQSANGELAKTKYIPYTVHGLYTFEKSMIVISNGRIAHGFGDHWEWCHYDGEFDANGVATVYGGIGSNWPESQRQTWVDYGDVIKVDNGPVEWRKVVPYDGIYELDSSTVEILGGRITRGTGKDWEYCRYAGEFENGAATIRGGRGSSWPGGFTQQWLIQGNSISVDDGKHIWQRI